MAMVGGDAEEGTGLAGAIGNAIRDQFPDVRLDDPAIRDFCNAIGLAVVQYIQDNAEVSVSLDVETTVETSSDVTVTSVSGVTVGAGTSGSGTGSATGTGTGTGTASGTGTIS